MHQPRIQAANRRRVSPRLRIANHSTRQHTNRHTTGHYSDFYSRPRTPRLCPPTHAIVFFLFYPYSRLTINHEPNHLAINRTCADISKSVEKRRRRRRDRGKESRNMRAQRISGRCNETRADMKEMRLKRKDGHGRKKKRENEFDQKYENRAGFFGTRRRRPAQKPTPMSPTHGTHPRESIIISLE
ncbi:LOW QUALITY PROTEIN: hypothetical protein V1477_018930 [Vespula maculifrons]|uniref:Uncharacterized protein n=1 Tax=Vespula maculifrons TaxID=7453 RepID=A0ABD2ASU2_VESMC